MRFVPNPGTTADPWMDLEADGTIVIPRASVPRDAILKISGDTVFNTEPAGTVFVHVAPDGCFEGEYVNPGFRYIGDELATPFGTLGITDTGTVTRTAATRVGTLGQIIGEPNCIRSAKRAALMLVSSEFGRPAKFEYSP
ncbi:hypothetical protein LZC95_27000 [Pendulispora brunnea]|uniref:Uncharacterized protein n=1 Tax=Pendulispora brunnea TaxID=2905690 RepID=A0ABZ2K161_9BACT